MLQSGNESPGHGTTERGTRWTSGIPVTLRGGEHSPPHQHRRGLRAISRKTLSWNGGQPLPSHPFRPPPGYLAASSPRQVQKRECEQEEGAAAAQILGGGRGGDDTEGGGGPLAGGRPPPNLYLLLHARDKARHTLLQPAAARKAMRRRECAGRLPALAASLILWHKVGCGGVGCLRACLGCRAEWSDVPCQVVR